jgi:hypothetical protein
MEHLDSTGKPNTWMDEISVESATPFTDIEWLQDWVEANLERSTISHKMQASIIRNLLEYTAEELFEIKKEREINWMNERTHYGRYGDGYVFIWWK